MSNPPSARRSCARPAESRSFVEALEQRVVLAAPWDLAGVGLYMEGEPTVYFGEAVMQEDGSLTGSRFDSGEAGPLPAVPIDFASVTNRPNGGIQVGFVEGFTPYDDQTGARFLEENGYPVGWFFGHDSGNARTELTFAVQRPESATTADIAGSWFFQSLTVNFAAERAFVHGGTASIGPGAIVVTLTGSPGTTPIAESHAIVSTGAMGRFNLVRGAEDSVLYMSADGSVIIWSDADAADGDIAIGIGVRGAPSPTAAGVAGVYRLVFSDVDDDGLDAEPDDFALTLEQDGSFTAVDLRDFDAGGADPAFTGAWTVSGSTLRLTLADGDVYQFIISDNGSTLLATDVIFQSGDFRKLLGVGTRIVADPLPPLDSLIALGVLNADGDPIAYDLRPDGEWRVVDLIARADGPTPTATADVEAWVDPISERLFAATSTPQGVYVYTRNEANEWTARNLTQELSPATRIPGDLTVFADLDGRVFVAGIDTGGNMVLYKNMGQNAQGNEVWSFENLVTTQLSPKNIPMPAIVGPLISYVTSWNGLNIAGLDAVGNIWSVWSGDGGLVWYANNLSTITGAPPISGGLTAYLTSWDGINIAGLNESGQLVVTWWVPVFVGEWETSNLTDIAGGPTLAGGTVTSYVAPWGGLNVAGLDTNGELVIYWWSPELEQNGETWQTADMTSGLPAEQPRPNSQLTSRVTDLEGGQLNVFGVDSTTNDLIRLRFSTDNPAWAIQNVTADAIPD
ncbi:MAG: hypothetical protein KJZ54_06575 [Phycisphaerales bacterium]|nr:hypothetical protein [Phycisphaerales bacterium]